MRRKITTDTSSSSEHLCELQYEDDEDDDGLNSSNNNNNRSAGDFKWTDEMHVILGNVICCVMSTLVKIKSFILTSKKKSFIKTSVHRCRILLVEFMNYVYSVNIFIRTQRECRSYFISIYLQNYFS